MILYIFENANINIENTIIIMPMLGCVNASTRFEILNFLLTCNLILDLSKDSVSLNIAKKSAHKDSPAAKIPGNNIHIYLIFHQGTDQL